MLPPTYFLCPPLSDDETAHLRSLAIDTAMRIVHQVHMDPESTSTAWSLHKVIEDGALRIYKGTAMSELGQPSGAHVTTQYIGHMTIEASLDEVIEVFRTDSPRRAALHRRRFGPSHIANTSQDKVTLYSALEHTTTGDYAAVTWHAYDAVPRVLRQFLSPRDECVLEVWHAFDWPTGSSAHRRGRRRGWVQGRQSVKLASCPDLQDTLGFVRVQNHGSGVVVLESESRPGFLDVYSLDHRSMPSSWSFWTNDHHTISSWVMRRLVSGGLAAESVRHMQLLRHVESWVREARLNDGTSLCTANADESTKVCAVHCHLCRKRFRWHWWSRKERCAKCGVVVCRSCCVQCANLATEDDNDAATRTTTTSSPPKTVPVCMDCCDVVLNAYRRRAQTHSRTSRRLRTPPVYPGPPSSSSSSMDI